MLQIPASFQVRPAACAKLGDDLILRDDIVYAPGERRDSEK